MKTKRPSDHPMILRVVGKQIEVNGQLIPLPQCFDIKLSPKSSNRRTE